MIHLKIGTFIIYPLTDFHAADGEGSVAIGINCIAIGTSTTAMGANSTASSNNYMAMGINSTINKFANCIFNEPIIDLV